MIAPEAPPSSVTAEVTSNPGELRISWLPPYPKTVNGVLLGYIIKATPQINDPSGVYCYLFISKHYIFVS